MSFINKNQENILSNKEGAAMTRSRKRIRVLAIVGMVLLFAGVSIPLAGIAVASGKEIGERQLRVLIGRMEDQGKRIQSTSVREINGEVEIILVLAGGET
ncbi:hypothetical protein KAR10_04295, partial [bacterium]|nr:hypothetical protein [bacterium]